MCILPWSVGVEEQCGSALWTCCHLLSPQACGHLPCSAGFRSMSMGWLPHLLLQPGSGGHLPHQEGMGRCCQLSPSVGPLLERAVQYACKPGHRWGRGALQCQHIWDSTPRCQNLWEPLSRSAPPVGFGEVVLVLPAVNPPSCTALKVLKPAHIGSVEGKI